MTDPGFAFEEVLSSRLGAALVTWSGDGIERALVGPLPPDSLLDLARRTH